MGLLGNCTFAGTITCKCTVPNTDTVSCYYLVTREGTATDVGAKTSGLLQLTNNCASIPNITIPTTICGAGILGILAGTPCTNCMNLYVTCWNNNNKATLLNSVSVFGCGNP